MQSKAIKSKIRAVGKTQQVAKAMEAVSAVKMRKAQEKALIARPFALSALSILTRISGATDLREHDFIKSREVQRTLMIVMTSDRGLAGSLNSAVLGRAVSALAERGRTKETVGVIALGRKASDYFHKRGWNMVLARERMEDFPALAGLETVASQALELYKKREFDEVLLCYTNFLSTFRQEAVVRKILPLDMQALREVVGGIVPVKGKFSDLYTSAPYRESEVYTLEPSPEDIFENLTSYLVSIFLYHGALEAKASEFSARMVAMKNAGDKAEDMGKSLNRQFNRARQAAITKEVSEIIGGTLIEI
ncbi:ATP synthase F1 subunit gamma [Candidatus Kaiserbacteria bacterium RIFCSPHIGHO2_01_FULL_51_33]|uniref:ATP synthase gamma chain n=1 Tax=Candidatus Kaiserbacteria bacterium RIFCSPLOWO2_01_FULL_51_21 TaxID=1798508 RepID=A0A1F6EDN4_9BACT|nr:MAG: ATP synthase F1 subunit gamma [Candidatus Kaiserbacteria bacterium RIFCSPHIGHO2_01_FULL_51_33]OGG71751.1 MAG: ATP synthase F1 subunit gamma [Candidatus Kaiserbacteria bacterium RIFCSPLOWO2_01_FULL_51_21]